MLSHLIFVVPFLEQGELEAVQVKERVHRLKQVPDAGIFSYFQPLSAGRGLNPENLKGHKRLDEFGSLFDGDFTGMMLSSGEMMYKIVSDQEWS